MKRFWDKVNIPKDPLNNCWEWKAGKGHFGHGRIFIDGKAQLAHRFAYFFFKGKDIKKDDCILHSCDNPPCCNPYHLRVGTRADNVKDKMKRGRHENLAKTHCKWGHPFSGENLKIEKTGARACRICARRNLKKYKLKKRSQS